MNNNKLHRLLIFKEGGVMYKFLVLSIPFLLAGCGNLYNHREEQTPIAHFTTKKSVQDTEECILSSWQINSVGGANVNFQKTGKYYTVMSVTDIADVYSDNNMTNIDYYSQRGALDPWRGNKKRIASIKSCL